MSTDECVPSTDSTRVIDTSEHETRDTHTCRTHP